MEFRKLFSSGVVSLLLPEEPTDEFVPFVGPIAFRILRKNRKEKSHRKATEKEELASLTRNNKKKKKHQNLLSRNSKSEDEATTGAFEEEEEANHSRLWLALYCNWLCRFSTFFRTMSIAR